MDLDEMITKAAAELVEAEAQFRAAQERMKELETIRDGLTLAKKHYGSVQASGPAVRTEADTGSLPGADYERSQTDLVHDALGTFNGTVQVQDIREALAALGHDLSRDQVRNALGYLLRKGRVVRPVAGQWRLPDPLTDATPAVPAAGVSTAGENGSTFQGVAVPAGAGLNSQPASSGS